VEIRESDAGIFVYYHLPDDLLRIENEKELDRIIDDLFSEDQEKLEIPLMIPARSN